jgi:hypothetical protein
VVFVNDSTAELNGGYMTLACPSKAHDEPY